MRVYKVIAGRELPEDQMRELLEKRFLPPQEGYKNRLGKEFVAGIEIKETVKQPSFFLVELMILMRRRLLISPAPARFALVLFVPRKRRTAKFIRLLNVTFATLAKIPRPAMGACRAFCAKRKSVLKVPSSSSRKARVILLKA